MNWLRERSVRAGEHSWAQREACLLIALCGRSRLIVNSCRPRRCGKRVCCKCMQKCSDESKRVQLQHPTLQSAIRGFASRTVYRRKLHLRRQAAAVLLTVCSTALSRTCRAQAQHGGSLQRAQCRQLCADAARVCCVITSCMCDVKLRQCCSYSPQYGAIAHVRAQAQTQRDRCSAHNAGSYARTQRACVSSQAAFATSGCGSAALTVCSTALSRTCVLKRKHGEIAAARTMQAAVRGRSARVLYRHELRLRRQAAAVLLLQSAVRRYRARAVLKHKRAEDVAQQQYNVLFKEVWYASNCCSTKSAGSITRVLVRLANCNKLLRHQHQMEFMTLKPPSRPRMISRLQSNYRPRPRISTKTTVCDGEAVQRRRLPLVPLRFMQRGIRPRPRQTCVTGSKSPGKQSEGSCCKSRSNVFVD